MSLVRCFLSGVEWPCSARLDVEGLSLTLAGRVVLVVGLWDPGERLVVLALVFGVRRLSMIPELTKVHYACITTRIEDYNAPCCRKCG